MLTPGCFGRAFHRLPTAGILPNAAGASTPTARGFGTGLRESLGVTANERRRCPLWESMARPSRFMCLANKSFPLPDRTYRLDDDCKIPSLGSLNLLGSGRTLWFVGDSMSGQHQRAVACRALFEVQDRIGGRPTLVHVTPTWAYELRRSRLRHTHADVLARQRVARDSLHSTTTTVSAAEAPQDGCQVKCTTITSGGHVVFQSCHVPSGVPSGPRDVDGISCHLHPLDAAELLWRHAIMLPGDTAFLNDGLWFSLSARLHHLTGLATQISEGAAAPGSLLAAHARGDALLVWRETSPQAFAGRSDGTWEASRAGWYQFEATRCVPVAEPTRRADAAHALHMLEHGAQHGVLRSRFWMSSGTRPRLPVLRVWQLSVTQWDAHIDQRTPHVYNRLDCTHWCEPSGVLEAWVDGTILKLAALHRPAPGPHSASRSLNVTAIADGAAAAMRATGGQLLPTSWPPPAKAVLEKSPKLAGIKPLAFGQPTSLVAKRPRSEG